MLFHVNGNERVRMTWIRDVLHLAGRPVGWHSLHMTKTATATHKASAPVKTRQSMAQKFRELPPAERKRRIAVMCDEVEAFWKDKPDTGAVAHLLKLRRGAA